MNYIENIFMNLNFFVLLQVTSLLLISVLLLFIVKTKKQQIRDQHDLSELKRDLRALTSAALGVGERVLKVERQQNNNEVKFDNVNKLSHNNDVSYEHAIHLVQKGVKVNQLVDSCGLSQGEADLVSLLHRIDSIGKKEIYNGKN
ncbi:hypothetical protein MNBD_GAMMA22-572 [hydrothermal vent metagenome]|uniref:DUF2802 domain-containing protein n=1 Tax=hydrothermal vent metagenome TaxID=652676 RepID=A0A3B0ZUW7_9ZZZZ